MSALRDFLGSAHLLERLVVMVFLMALLLLSVPSLIKKFMTSRTSHVA